MMSSIENATVEALMNAFHKISQQEGNLKKIVFGKAPSTKVYQMQEQCEMVMKLHIKSAGGYANVLCFALVSHALDARHLAAALAGMDRLPNFKAFFQGCLEDEQARELIKIRLQQVVYLILMLKNELKISDHDLSAYLKSQI